MVRSPRCSSRKGNRSRPARCSPSSRRRKHVAMFSRLRSLRFLRYVGIGLASVLAILAIAVFVSLRIDLGPSLRALAERQGSSQLKRPVHIGALSIRIARGRFEIDDFSIEGVNPGDRPFFAAKQLSISLDW